MMLPILEFCQSGESVSTSDLNATIADLSEVQAFAGSLEGNRAKKGVFITTSQFSPEATAYVTQIGMKIILIDGQQLSEMMIDHEVGVTVEETYAVRRIDSDYFSEE